jgi:hypothetical protein
MVNRHEWVVITHGDQGGQLDSAQVARAEERLDPDVSRDRGQEAAPGARALDGVVATAEEVGPGGIVPVDPLGIHQAADNAGARLALGGDPDDNQGSEAVRVAGRELEGRHCAHGKAEEVERVEAEGIDEGKDIVDELASLEAIGPVPTG